MNLITRCGMAGTLGAALLTSGSALTTGTPVAASAVCRPSVRVLPDLGFGSDALAFNRDTVVGDVIRRDGTPAAAMWRDGKLVVIGAGFRASRALDINPKGQIVGAANAATQGWVRQPDGQVQLMSNPTPDTGPFSMAPRRINTSGQVAGAVGLDPSYAARWDTPTSDPVLLQPAPSYVASYAKGLNDAGWVGGDVDNPDPDYEEVTQAATWSPGGHVHVLAGLFDGLAATGWVPSSGIYEINDGRVSAGESVAHVRGTDIFRDEATIWRADGTPVGLGFLPGSGYSVALGLSSTSEVAGVSYAESDPLGHAFVWSSATGMLALPVAGAASYIHGQSQAHQIEGGMVAGQSAPDAASPLRATVWRCAFEQAFRPSHVTLAPPGEHSAGRPAGAHPPSRG